MVLLSERHQRADDVTLRWAVRLLVPLRMELSSVALSLPQGGGNEKAAFVPPLFKSSRRSFVLGQSVGFQRWKRLIKETLLALGSPPAPIACRSPTHPRGCNSDHLFLHILLTGAEKYLNSSHILCHVTFRWEDRVILKGCLRLQQSGTSKG